MGVVKEKGEGMAGGCVELEDGEWELLKACGLCLFFESLSADKLWLQCRSWA